MWFWSGLSLAARLQYIALVLFLGTMFVIRDLDPRMRWFGLPLWQITGPLILLMLALGRILLPLMLRSPQRTQRFLSFFGLAVFVLGVVSANQRWGRLLIVYLTLTLALWLDVSCSFWFISEIQRRLQGLRESLKTHSENDVQEFEDEQDRAE